MVACAVGRDVLHGALDTRIVDPVAAFAADGSEHLGGKLLEVARHVPGMRPPPQPNLNGFFIILLPLEMALLYQKSVETVNKGL